MSKSFELLEKYWGYTSFRPLQEEIIEASIYGKDVFALLPTGGGKSICFQIPGLAREGITIVITPLIALMNDQVDQLEKKGVRAQMISSLQSYREIDTLLDNAKFGAFDFLYISPERIQTKLFIERFKQMQVALIVVDEAHCISEWGHDFRPTYLEISKLREVHPEVPIMAVTATATTYVKNEICEKLKLNHQVEFEASFKRSNLSYEVKEVVVKEQTILNWLVKFPQLSGIIYCQTRKNVKDLANFLISNKINCGIYHGGLDGDQRKKMMDQWMSDQVPLMIATNAFGMGIDKPNVRYIIHYEFPMNLEAYFQEAGRAGRDGKEARTFVLFSEKDIERNDYLLNKKFPDISVIKSTLRALYNFLKLAIGSGKGETFSFSLTDFCSNFKLDIVETFESLKILEMNGDLHFDEGSYAPTRLKFSVNNKLVYSFQIKYDKISTIVHFLTRNFPGIFDNYCVISEKKIVEKLKITLQDVQNQLIFLEQNGIIDINWSNSLPKVTFLHERLPDDYIRLTPEVYQTRKERAIHRWEKAKDYLLLPHCREQYILDYFGQQGKPCGKCDYCKSTTLVNVSRKLVIETILELLSIKSYTLQMLYDEAETVSSHAIDGAIHHLIQEELIVYIHPFYSIKSKNV